MGFAWRGFPSGDARDAVIFTIGIALPNGIAFGYSYDYTVSSLGPATGGSHELTLAISFNEGGKNLKRDSIPCPDVVKFKMFGDKESYR
jgi:hypothetical protein